DDLEAGRRTERHPQRHRPIEVHDGGWYQLGERVIERHDTGPVGLFRRAGSRVTGGNRGLERVRAVPAAGRLGALQRRQTAADEEVVPPSAVLIEQQDRLARWADTRPRA